MNGAGAAVTRFNAMINARDADGLARLMTDDHRFVDSAGQAVSGRQACRDAWSGFFAAFSVGERDGVVVVTGRSVCSEHPDLAGPALWTARVDGGLVAEWRVYDDTPETRAELGVTA
jgi:ketosteroid isomerase-like protein